MLFIIYVITRLEVEEIKSYFEKIKNENSIIIHL